MQIHDNQKSMISTTTVRLFPRLAPASVLTRHVCVERPATRERIARNSTTTHQGDRAQVRAQLLRMILDNERSRRNAPRPSAS
jgi:hypothetical protein